MAVKNRSREMDEMFTTNQFKVLEALFDNTLVVAGREFCPLGQAEIADELGMSRVNVNRIFKQLRDAGYITMISRGKWALSEKADAMVRGAKKL